MAIKEYNEKINSKKAIMTIEEELGKLESILEKNPVSLRDFFSQGRQIQSAIEKAEGYLTANKIDDYKVIFKNKIIDEFGGDWKY